MTVNPIKGTAPNDTGSGGVYPSLGNPLGGPSPKAGSTGADKRERSSKPERGKASKAHPAPTQPGKNPTPDEHNAICSRDGHVHIRKRPVG